MNKNVGKKFAIAFSFYSVRFLLSNEIGRPTEKQTILFVHAVYQTNGKQFQVK